MTTATSTCSSSIDRSDSSASTTSHSPAPQSAFRPVVRSAPPIRYAGSIPMRSSAWAIIDVVVVFPCAPPTAIVRFRRLICSSRSARGRSGSPRWCAATRSAFESGIALEWNTSTSSPGGTFAASWPTWTATPSDRNPSSAGPSARSEPETVAPSCVAMRA